MKMPIRILTPVLLLAVIILSCKTQKAPTASDTHGNTQPNSNQTSADYEAPPSGERKDPISEKKAKEEATFIEGCVYKLVDNKKAALGEFQEVLNMNPENDAANYEVAGLYHALGQSDRALKYAAEAVRLDPANIWYKFRYAEILQAVHRDAEAVALFKDLVAAQPNNTDLQYRLAQCQFKADQNSDALSTYDAIEKLEGNSDTLGRCRMEVYRRDKNDAGIEKTLNGLIKAFPAEEKYYYELASFYEERSQQVKANEVYNSMAVKFPYAATPKLKLAEVHNKSGQWANGYTDALIAFAIPEQLNNKIAYLDKWYNISDTATQALSPAKKKEADSLCRVLRRTHKDEAESFIVSGDYLMEDHRFKDARVMYRKAIDMSKDFYTPWKQIMKLNAEAKDDVQQEKDCKEIMELFPSQPHAYYYTGEIQFRKKKYADAILNLQTASDYNFDDPGMDREIRLMLIQCYRATGRQKDADALTEKMIKAEPENMQLKADLAASLLAQKKEYFRAEQMMLEVVEKEPHNASYWSLLGWIEYNMADYKLADEYMRKALAITPQDAVVNERMGDIQFRLKNTDEAVLFWTKAKNLGNKSPELEEKIKNRAVKDEY